MKLKLLCYVIFCVSLCEVSCSSDIKERVPPQAGIIIAADSTRIVEDQLNDMYFSATLKTTDRSDSGEYSLHAAWGYNEANSNIRFPKGFEQVTPAIRRDTSTYSYLIGFYVEGDTAFHDYYSIIGRQGIIEMRYIKTYFYQ